MKGKSVEQANQGQDHDAHQPILTLAAYDVELIEDLVLDARSIRAFACMLMYEWIRTCNPVLFGLRR